MNHLKWTIRATIGLGVLSLLAGLMTHLALTDIYHGEADVTLEWNIVRTSACLLIVFIGMAMYSLGRVLKGLG